MKLNIFTTTRKDGLFTKEKKYYPNLTKEEIDKLYDNKVNKLFRNNNINNYYIMNNKNDKIGKKTITNNNKSSKDYIYILKEDNINTPVLVETDDDPVIVGYAKDENDKTTVAIGLGTIENLNNDLIRNMTEALMMETNAATFEMTFYIGPCPTKENYIIDKSTELNEKVFKKSIEDINNEIHLDIRYTIFNELYLEIVDPNNIYFDSTDTVSTDKYYSKLGNKAGKHATCILFTKED